MTVGSVEDHVWRILAGAVVASILVGAYIGAVWLANFITWSVVTAVGLYAAGAVAAVVALWVIGYGVTDVPLKLYVMLNGRDAEELADHHFGAADPNTIAVGDLVRCKPEKCYNDYETRSDGYCYGRAYTTDPDGDGDIKVVLSDQPGKGYFSLASVEAVQTHEIEEDASSVDTEVAT